MPASDELYPPAQYGGGWLLLALGILVLLILAAVLVIVLTRPRRSITVPGLGSVMPATAGLFAQLRADYLNQIALIEQAHQAGQIDDRRANLELSRTVRTFVNEYSGLEAPVLTLDDLVERGVHPALIDALGRHYYPSIFQRGPAIDPAQGAEAARTVVRSWH